MSWRMWYRTLRFIAWNWSLPFLAGCALSMFLISWGNVELLVGWAEVFDASFNAVVATCAP